MPDRDWLIDSLDQRPAMFGLDGSFAGYCAYLSGYDHGADATWMQGSFQPWLVSELGTGANLGWGALILQLAFPDTPELWHLHGRRSEAEDEHARSTLFDRLRAFAAAFPESDRVPRTADGSYEIVFPPELEGYEWEVEMKGWLPNIRVRSGSREWELTAYDLVRLSQTAEDELRASQYSVYSNLLIVPAVTREAITQALTAMAPCFPDFTPQP